MTKRGGSVGGVKLRGRGRGVGEMGKHKPGGRAFGSAVILIRPTRQRCVGTRREAGTADRCGKDDHRARTSDGAGDREKAGRDGSGGKREMATQAVGVVGLSGDIGEDFA